MAARLNNIHNAAATSSPPFPPVRPVIKKLSDQRSSALSRMPSDDELARRSLDLQKRARDIPLTQIPGYMEWTKQKLAKGECEALIAHLDAAAIWLLPENVGSVSTDDFDEMLNESKDTTEDIE